MMRSCIQRRRPYRHSDLDDVLNPQLFGRYAVLVALHHVSRSIAGFITVSELYPIEGSVAREQWCPHTGEHLSMHPLSHQ